MDRLDRRLIQLKIEREAVRKEKDEGSVRRFGLIQDEIAKLEREAADLDEVWKAEKAAAQGSKQFMEDIEKARLQIEDLKRKGDFNKVAELQYGTLPELEKKLHSAQAKEAAKAAKAPAAAANRGRREDRRGRLARHRIPVSKRCRANATSCCRWRPAARRVVGQDEAITAVADAIRRSRAGLSDPTGHSQLSVPGPHRRRQDRAVQCAGRFLFDSDDHMIRVDMSGTWKSTASAA